MPRIASVALPLGERKRAPLANVLAREKRIAVLHALVNANSERSAADLANVNARTVARLNVEFGTGAARLHDKIARDLVCTDIECDETWSYVGKKQARVTPEDPPEVGEAYTWTALDRASRFVIAFHVGKRTAEHANVFMADVRARLVLMPAISTDGLAAYVAAVGVEFGRSVDYGQMSKNYRSGALPEKARWPPHSWAADRICGQHRSVRNISRSSAMVPGATVHELSNGRGFLRFVFAWKPWAPTLRGRPMSEAAAFGLAFEPRPTEHCSMSPAALVVIENVDDNGTHWYLSFDGPNPTDDQCVRCVDRDEAFKLKKIVETMSTVPSFGALSSSATR